MIRWGCGDQGPVKPGVTHDDRPVEDPEERSSRRCEPSVRELLGRQGWARRWRASRLGWRLSSVTSVRIRRNSGETIANYAASRISQLRKSSSAASHPPPRASTAGALRRDVSPKPKGRRRTPSSSCPQPLLRADVATYRSKRSRTTHPGARPLIRSKLPTPLEFSRRFQPSRSRNLQCVRAIVRVLPDSQSACCVP